MVDPGSSCVPSPTNGVDVLSSPVRPLTQMDTSAVPGTTVVDMVTVAASLTASPTASPAAVAVMVAVPSANVETVSLAEEHAPGQGTLIILARTRSPAGRPD